MLKAPLLASATSESSDAVVVVRNGEAPMGKHDTGNPSAETSCSHAMKAHTS